jgi:hypothetical protein
LNGNGRGADLLTVAGRLRDQRLGRIGDFRSIRERLQHGDYERTVAG